MEGWERRGTMEEVNQWTLDPWDSFPPNGLEFWGLGDEDRAQKNGEISDAKALTRWGRRVPYIVPHQICPLRTEKRSPELLGKPGTSGPPIRHICANFLVSPELGPEFARNFWPPELPGGPELPGSLWTRYVQTLWLTRNFPGTSGPRNFRAARNFRPRRKQPAYRK